MSIDLTTVASRTDPDFVFHSATVPAVRCWPAPAITVPRCGRRAPLRRLVPDQDDKVAREQARRLVAGLLRGIVEVFDGRRSCAQLTQWCCPDVLTTVEVWQRAVTGRRLRVRSVRVMLPHPRTIEAVAALQDGDQTLAAVLRLDRSGAHWLCTVFDVLARGRECLH